ncbi:hypothetical protein L1889_15870 [Paenalcaligenes niemegkensis]|uniref:hypothetical protein n=1 Tax=Paenalcaligenes niemegkensis TaxID=2895469 RepID=UPI001EE81409|nr:hypothetical protein [Paenalcaligenes niemegkensis]MCQ9617962.1 hypothetical protein [Paenalcaligenes niemegkensis]
MSGQLDEIAAALEAQTAAIVVLVEEAERQARIREEEWQALREQWRREEQAKRQAKAYDDAQAELLSIINDWNEAERITKFFEAALLKASEVSDEFRTEIENRLAQAQSIIGAKTRLNGWQNGSHPRSGTRNRLDPSRTIESMPDQSCQRYRSHLIRR